VPFFRTQIIQAIADEKGSYISCQRLEQHQTKQFILTYLQTLLKINIWITAFGLCNMTAYLQSLDMILAWICSDRFYSNYISGNEVVSYESPKPSAGIHRFVFVLFRQSVRQTIYAPGWRQNFNTRDFSALYNLGPPVASVFFNCQRENGCGGRRYIRWYSLRSFLFVAF
jgi:hypothetical protein